MRDMKATLINSRVYLVFEKKGETHISKTDFMCLPKNWDYYNQEFKDDPEMSRKLNRIKLRKQIQSKPLSLPFLNHLEMKATWVDTAKLLRRFDKDCDWSSLNQDYALKFRDWLLTEAKKKDGSLYSSNTFSQHYAHIKSAITSAIRNGHPSANERIFGLRIKKEESTKVYLTESELKSLECVDLKGAEDLARKMFLIGAYSGARISDFKNFSEDNMVDGKLKYMSQKTGALIVTVLHPYVKSVLNEVFLLTENRSITEASERVYVNRCIKSICKKAGITENVLISKKEAMKVSSSLVPKYSMVTSHTARRSFATNLAIKKYPIISIQKFLGHSNVIVTSRYILCDGGAF